MPVSHEINRLGLAGTYNGQLRSPSDTDADMGDTSRGFIGLAPEGALLAATNNSD
jgi:hypothetical protein